MAMPTPQQAAAKWSTNMGAAVTRYADGVKAVTTSPNALAAAAVDRYMAGVQASQQKYVQRNQGVSLQYWQQQSVTKGSQRLASGATAAEGKMGQVFTQLFPYIEQVRGSLPARGDLEQNIARSAAFQRGMARFQLSGSGL